MAIVLLSVTLTGPLLGHGYVVGLSDIVEREQLHHQVMHAVLAGLDQGQAMAPRVDVDK